MNIAEIVAQTFDEGDQGATHIACAATPRLVTVWSGTMEAAPEKAATSLQGLTNPSPESAKTRGERMATHKHRGID